MTSDTVGEHGCLRPADTGDVRAAVRERTAGVGSRELRCGTGQHRRAMPVQRRLHRRRGPDQGLGVGMPWLGRHQLRRTFLHHPAPVQHQDPVGHEPDHIQVVADEQVAQRQPVPQRPEQVQYLRLDGDVERGHRFVADHELRLSHQRAGDRDPLPLPAGKAPRILRGGRAWQPDLGEQLGHPLPASGPRRASRKRLKQGGANRDGRVQRTVRILEDHLDLRAERPADPPRRAGDVLPAEHDGSAVHRYQAEYGPADRGLASPGLSDQPDHLTGRDGE